MENENKHFVRAALPWLVAAGALVVYLVTLNHWVSMSGLPQLARIAGWDWQPDVHAPLYFLLTYPFRWLPTAWLPMALNLFSAGCAALTLALLARSVALLPHDRTHDQRQREQSEGSLLTIPMAWLPPLLAVLACGLQLTFWENATAASGEMLDLLVFAYCVRCLLEYRLDPRQGWMTCLALVYGAGAANNWAMIGYFPLFLVAVIWIKGVGFFNPRFLLRTTAAGLVGLSLCLLLPLVQSLATDPQLSFWEVLRSEFRVQKYMVMAFPFNRAALFFHEKPLWVLGLTSLLPVLVMKIRWPSYFGDTSPLGVSLATVMFHLMHGFFLLACAWVVFDPPFSGRAYGQVNEFNPLFLNLYFPSAAIYPSFLTIYYLCAFCIGCLSGYFLLVFGRSANRASASHPVGKLSPAITAGIVALLVVVPVGLIYKNLPQVRTTNGPWLSRYASLLAESLPNRGAVVLSDDPRRLYLLRAALGRRAATADHILLLTYDLPYPAYHRWLGRTRPDQWREPASTNQVNGVIPSPALVQLMLTLSRDHGIFYLHPSFGYYFERFYHRPRGMVYELKLYPTNSIGAPPLDLDGRAQIRDFWRRNDDGLLSSLSRLVAPPMSAESGWGEKFLRTLRSLREPVAQARMLGTFCSQALTYCGDEFQRAGQPEEAAWYFARALDLNPDNVVARVNRQCNQNLQASQPAFVELTKALENRLGRYRNLVQAATENGPFDEPNFCFEQGRIYAKGGLYRQASQQFERARVLSPNHLAARLALAYLFSVWQMPDRVLELAGEVHASPDRSRLSRNHLIELAYVEAAARFATRNPEAAVQAVEAALGQLPEDADLLAAATTLYLANGRYSNALPIIEKHLQLAPDNPTVLFNQAVAYIQLNACESAIPPLDRVLALQTNNFDALFNRAVAYLRSGNLDASRRDYETLEKALPAAHQIQYGLGEIAYRRKETARAIRHYELYLTQAPPNTSERRLVADRLGELKKNPP